ncbi:MAG: hypothetical protein HYW23_02615 [Candidatus Aenigmarchaeota archaeon]|nr:hypothetical protein [Candidatus Aenigmarchaeota archaeon]
MPKRKRNNSDMREEALRHAFVKILMRVPIRNARVFDSRVSLQFFGHKISDKVVMKKEDHVAEWSRRRKEVFIDNKIGERDRKKSFKALCVHEVIEKFLAEKFGLRLDTEAHVVATQKEKEYLESIGGNWRSHELIVYWDWHRLGEH